MRALVICPDFPAELPFLERKGPLALMAALGPSLLQHALHRLAEAGARRVTVLASDRGEEIRVAIGSGERWGLQVEVVLENHELSPEEARRKYRADAVAGWLKPGADVGVANRHPDAPFSDGAISPRRWIEGLQQALPRAHRHRLGVREIEPGVWVGLRAQIEPGARFVAPCWIGEDVRVRTGAVIGAGSVVEDFSFIDREAEVTDSWIGPRTYVGAMTHVNRSLAWGRQLLNCETGSCVEVADAFLLADLDKSPKRDARPWLSSVSGWPGGVVSAVRRGWRRLLPS